MSLSCTPKSIGALLLTLLVLTAAPIAKAGDDRSIRVLLIPRIETTFSSEIAATIQELTVDFGDRFHAGQKLISFDCEMYRVGLKKARAELAEARKTFEVNSQLEKLLSVSQLEVAVSEARMQRAEAEVELKETEVTKCEVSAPFSGRVVRRAANQFQFVTPGQPLLEVIDDTNLNIQLFIPSDWLSWIGADKKFTVFIDETQKEYQAAVTVLGAKVDQVSQTLEIRARILGKQTDLLAGMSGTAFFKK